MKLEDIYTNYVLNDGQILLLQVNYSDRSSTLRLRVRKRIDKTSFETCEIELLFIGVISIDISEDFGTNGNYSDITFTKTSNAEFYISLDPFTNTNDSHANDNSTIVSKTVILKINDEEQLELS